MWTIPSHLDLPRPYLVFNRHYARVHPVWKDWRTRLKEELLHDNGKTKVWPTPNIPEIVSDKGIERGNFYRDAAIIDKNCNLYKVIGFETFGLHRDIWNLYGLSKRKNVLL